MILLSVGHLTLIVMLAVAGGIVIGAGAATAARVLDGETTRAVEVKIARKGKPGASAPLRM